MIIYKTTNLINNKIYIGKDKYNNPNYLGSGKLLNQAIKKYGIENFKKEIIQECNSDEELNQKEIYWISFYNSTDRNIGYNLTNGGTGGNTWNLNQNKQETSKKLSVKSKGRKHSESTKQKLSELRSGEGNGMFGKPSWNKGKHTPEEVKQKIREKNKGLGAGRKLSKETKQKISELHKNKPKSEEHKKKISETLTGRKIDPEVIEKTASKLRGRKQPTDTCPYCNKTCSIIQLKRYHYDKCKQKNQTSNNNQT